MIDPSQLESYVNAVVNAALAEIRDELRERVHAKIANLIESTTIATASEGNNQHVLVDILAGWGADEADESEANPDARRMEPPGFAYVPMEKEPTISMGMGANQVHFPLASTKYRPKGLKQGESAQYNLNTEKQGISKIDKDGNITITAPAQREVTIVADGGTIKISSAGKITIDAKAGQDVQVNGGSKKVARDGDRCGWLSWETAVIGMTTVIIDISWTSTEPLPPPLPPKFSIPLYITEGADRFKG